MKAKLAKLIDVKSIMTLVLTVVFCVLALKGVVTGQEFLTIFTVIVGFYFGTQSQKSAEKARNGQPQPEQAQVQEADTEYTGNEMQPEMTMDALQPPDDMQPIGFER